MSVTMTCFQLFSYAYSDDTTSPRPLCTVCCLWLYVGILGTQAFHCSVRSDVRRILLLLLEFSDICWRGLVVSHMLTVTLWRWLWDIRVWIHSTHLSVNFSCLTTLDTTELTNSSLVLFFVRISIWKLRISLCDAVRIWSDAPVLLCCSWSVIDMLHTRSWDGPWPTVFTSSVANGFYLNSRHDWVAEFHTCDIDWLALFSWLSRTL
jgi:hypothetical protein